MDTAHAHPENSQPLGASLRRSADDRILLGLCAGLARSAGISPLAFRLGTVAVSFLLLPIVLLSYTVAAVLVPRDDGAALVGSGWRDRRDLWIALGLTLLAAPVALSVGGAGGFSFMTAHFGFVFLPLVALGLLAFLAIRRDRPETRTHQATPAAAPTPQPAAPVPSATVAADDAGATSSVATDDTAVTSIVDTAATAAVAAMREQADEATRAQDPTEPAHANQEPPHGPTFVQAPRPPQPEGPRRPGFTIPVLASVAMVPAFFGMLLAAGAVEPQASSWAVMFAVMAVVAAGGAVAIAVLRPSYLGAGFLVLLAVALGITSIGVGQFGGVLDDGVGERVYRVSNPDDLTTPFVLGAGEMNIDLRPLRLEPRQRVTVQARLGFGEMNIAVPRGARILTTRASNASALTTTARENGAATTESATAPTIVLDLRGRGVDARVVTGRDRDVSDLDILAQTSLGFWSGNRSDGPFDTRFAR